MFSPEKRQKKKKKKKKKKWIPSLLSTHHSGQWTVLKMM